MKTIKIALFALAGSLVVSCSDLDLSPNDKAASGSWYQTAEQFELNLNACSTTPTGPWSATNGGPTNRPNWIC